MAGGKHGPNRYANYFAIHDAAMDRYRSHGVVVADNLVVEDVGDDLVMLSGSIDCDGVIVDVEKYLDAWETPAGERLVQTVQYTYCAHLRRVGNVFRYCSPHETHNKEHHVHRYDVLAGDTKGTVDFIVDEDKRPTLGEVIAEAWNWRNENLSRITWLDDSAPRPVATSTLSRRR